MANVSVRTNLDLRGHLQFQQVADFPASPKPGQTCFKGGILFIFATIGGIETWYPTNRPQSSYVHSQGLESLTWTLRHNLGTTDVIVAVYDTAGQIVNASITITDANTVVVELTEAIAGHAVVFGHEQISAPVVTAQKINADEITVQNQPVAVEDDVATAFDGMATEFEQSA